MIAIFLTASQSLCLNSLFGKLYEYQGNYEDYLLLARAERERIEETQEEKTASVI